MKTFAIFTKSNHVDELENAVFLEERFSFLAALFQSIWALYHRMWWAAGILLSLSIAITILESKDIISLNLSAAFNLGLFAYIGLSASDWREQQLLNKGFHLSNVIKAKTLEEAQRRYYEAELTHHYKTV